MTRVAADTEFKRSGDFEIAAIPIYLRHTATSAGGPKPCSLLVKNGEIITATDRYVADLWVENETIKAIGRDLEAPPSAEIMDATGKYVFPGFIDPHVHVYLPFMGTFAKDSHETASQAALVGARPVSSR